MPQGQPQRVEFEGQVHEFPPDFTDADIQKALSSHAPAQGTSTESPTKAAWRTQQRPQVQVNPAFQANYDPNSTTKNILANVGRQGTGAVLGMKELGSDILSNPNWMANMPPGQRPSTFQKFVAQPAGEMATKARQANKQGRDAEALGYTAAAALPFAGPWAASLGEQAGSGDISGAAGGLVGGLIGGKAGTEAVGRGIEAVDTATSPLFWKTGLDFSTRTMLENAKNTRGLAPLATAEGNITRNVGNLRNTLAARDVMNSPEPKVNLTKAAGAIDEIYSRYASQDRTLPGFEKATDLVSPTAGYVNLDQALKIKSELGKVAGRITDAADKGAVLKLQGLVNDAVKERVTDLGPASVKDLAAYNKQWESLQNYRDGILGQLQNAPNGKAFFDQLYNKDNNYALRQMQKDFANHGLDPNWLDDLKSDHEPLYKYIVNSEKTGIGKLRALTKHPIAAGAGFVGGHAAGGFLGGIAGAILAGSLVDRVRAVKAMRELGGVQPIEGEMGELGKVKGQPTPPPAAPAPSASSPAPTPATPSGPSSVAKDVQSALVNLGYKKADAAGMAAQGAAAFPNDFDKAFAAAQGKPTLKDVANPARDTSTLKAVQQEHPEWTLSQQLQEAAKRVKVGQIREVKGGK